MRFVDEHAVRRGEFKLASGLISNYYIDGKQVTSSPIGLNLLADAIRKELANFPVDAIGGLELGAIPIAAAAAMASVRWDSPISAFTVRKAKKEHGSRKRIEGIAPQGARVAVVDDVVTSGGSIVQAIDAIRGAGCTVALAIAMVDRLSGTSEALEAYGVPYTALLTIEDLGLSNDQTRPGSNSRP
jgi:orotate phosphoribosyltransferase